MTTPTQDQLNAFQAAFGHFNRALFGNGLPQVHLTFMRPRANHAAGMFRPREWADADGRQWHSIALNPMHLESDGDRVAQTLVHEMVHLWQEENGYPSDKYHNNEWAKKMLEVGLQPDFRQDPKYRQRASQTVVVGGRFENAFRTLGKETLLPLRVPLRRPDTSRNKVGYDCEHGTVWGEPGRSLICPSCGPLKARPSRRP